MKYKHYGPIWYRLLRAVHFGALGGLVYAMAAGFLLVALISPAMVQRSGASSYNVFSPDAFWTSRLPRYPQLHADSSGLVNALVAQVSAAGSSFDTDRQAAPVYEAYEGVPAVTVQPRDCGNGLPDPEVSAQWQQVPLPFYALPGAGSAQALVIYEPSSQSVWEFGGMQKDGSTWGACRGGKISPASASTGTFVSGITATGLARLAGQVSISELQTGVIQHAMGLSLPSLSADPVWPALHYDGSGSGQLYPGMRLQLDPEIDVDSLGLPVIARMIAKAAQTYGFVVWDTDTRVTVLGENPLSYTARGAANPYAVLGPSGSGILADFPWDKLRVLPAGYGQSPVVPVIYEFTAQTATLPLNGRAALSWRAANASQCTVPGVTGAEKAAGTAITPPLTTAMRYTLSCSGPRGTASRELYVSVVGQLENEASPELEQAVVIVSPLSGNSISLPQITGKAPESVQKVAYYKSATLLQATTVPPYALNTEALPDGIHSLTVEVRYRGGHSERFTAQINVRNRPQPLLLPPASMVAAAPALPPLWGGVAIAGSFVAMGAAGWYGWRRYY